MADVEALIEDFAARAAATLDGPVLDYFAGGSGREVSLAEARPQWLRYRLLPRVLMPVGTVDTMATILGASLPSPLGIAPVAFQGELHADGEVATARGADGHLLIVPTRATRRLEDIAAATTGPWWFQVYVTRDRGWTEALVGRAVRAGAAALVLTGDTPYIARKARGGRPAPLGAPATVANAEGRLLPGADPAVALEQDPDASLDDLGWLADLSGLPVLVKGVLRADDAVRCLRAGAAGVIVSNHGGRQLDRAAATAAVLPDVVAAAGGAPVLVDGGVRSGLDVLTALALGACGVLVGRPAAWALACDGEPGMTGLLRAFDSELAHVLGLAGCASVGDVTADLIASV